MTDPRTSAAIVVLSAIALLILLNAVRKTIARKEWDSAALLGALSVLSLNVAYLVATYHGEWTIVVNRFQTEFLVSNWGRWSLKLATAGLVVVSVAIFFRAIRRKASFNPAAVLFLLVAVASILSTILNGDNPFQPYALLLLVVLVACTVAPRGLGIHVGIGTCCMIVAIASGFTIADHADFSVLPCTYKCGVLGFMFRGIFSHENALAMFLALAMPFVFIAFGSWEGPVLSAYILGLVLISGGRLSAMAAVVTFVALILARPNLRRTTSAPTRATVLALALTIMIGVGIALPFYTDDPGALSDRGNVWLPAREALADPATLLHGTGMLGWQRHFLEVGLKYTYSVHNQWLQILYSTGLIGFLLFVAAIALLIRHAGRTYRVVVLCVLLPVFILSATEQPWPIDVANWLMWAVPGALLCYPVSRRSSDDQGLETPRDPGELAGGVVAIAEPRAIGGPSGIGRGGNVASSNSIRSFGELS